MRTLLEIPLQELEETLRLLNMVKLTDYFGNQDQAEISILGVSLLIAIKKGACVISFPSKEEGDE